MPTAIPARQMRRPNENARMGDRSHRATCLHMADSEQVMGNSDPQSSRTANTNLSAGGANMSGNATTAANGRKNRMVMVSFTRFFRQASTRRNAHVPTTSTSATA